MRILLDMNLSPGWVPLLQSRGWDACHWSDIGRHNAPDSELMCWARQNSHIVLTQDLDFSQLLFSTGDAGPSVVLLRMKDEFDETARAHVLDALAAAEISLGKGALLIVSGDRARLRTLPL